MSNFFWGDTEINDVNQFRDFCKEVYPHNHNVYVVFGANENLAAIDRKTLSESGAVIFPDEIDEKMKESFSEDFLTDLKEFVQNNNFPKIC